MSHGKKKGLGRGLSALFGDQAVKEKADVSKKLTTISISDLSRNPYQPRDIFNDAKLEELSNSIKKRGIIQPIAVRLKKNESNKYEIVAGERRWLAAQKAGLHEIPVNILDINGRLVKTLINKRINSGFNTITWDSNNAAGIYFLQLVAEDFVSTQKIIHLK